ncbi:hypothetical protein PCE1_001114 [Barthelona sp. PCE]
MSSPLSRTPLSKTGLHATKDMPKSPSQKLSQLTERFSGFQNDVEIEMQQRRSEEDRKFVNLIDQVNRIEKNLTAETRRRQENIRAAQIVYENRITAAVERLDGAIVTKFNELNDKFGALDSRIEAIELGLQEEVQARTSQSSELLSNFSSRITELQECLDSERSHQVEREASLMQRVTSDIYRIQEKTDAERLQRETAINVLMENIENNLKLRGKAEETLRQRVAEDYQEIKVLLETEREEREKGDEDLVVALEQLMSNMTRSISALSRR